MKLSASKIRNSHGWSLSDHGIYRQIVIDRSRSCLASSSAVTLRHFSLFVWGKLAQRRGGPFDRLAFWPFDIYIKSVCQFAVRDVGVVVSQEASVLALVRTCVRALVCVCMRACFLAFMWTRVLVCGRRGAWEHSCVCVSRKSTRGMRAFVRADVCVQKVVQVFFLK